MAENWSELFQELRVWVVVTRFRSVDHWTLWFNDEEGKPWMAAADGEVFEAPDVQQLFAQLATTNFRGAPVRQVVTSFAEFARTNGLPNIDEDEYFSIDALIEWCNSDVALDATNAVWILDTINTLGDWARTKTSLGQEVEWPDELWAVADALTGVAVFGEVADELDAQLERKGLGQVVEQIAGAVFN